MKTKPVVYAVVSLGLLSGVAFASVLVLANLGKVTSIQTTMVIQRPIIQVFRFVTTPANWPKWHPSSLHVSGAVDHPLTVGEPVVETFRVAGRRGQITWRVTERIWPSHWVIKSQGNSGGYAIITYTLTSQGEGTRFQRELMYRMPERWLSLLNWLVLRHRIARESADALRNLKQVMERHQHEAASVESAQIRQRGAVGSRPVHSCLPIMRYHDYA